MVIYYTNRHCPNCDTPTGTPVRFLNYGTVGCGDCEGNGLGGVNQKHKSTRRVCSSEL